MPQQQPAKLRGGKRGPRPKSQRVFRYAAVRCLGPGDTEHKFRPELEGERFCPRCRERIADAERLLSPRCRPVRVDFFSC